jgi:PAS domain S-box-containing protein
MDQSGSYEELLKQYRELQLRITRFSFVEQQLINTRDRLDHELVMYKRLNKFNQDALEEMSEESFLELVAEAIVDIFEIECSFVKLYLPGQTGYIIHHVGMDGHDMDKEVVAEELASLGNRLQLDKAIGLNIREMSDFQMLSECMSAVFFQFRDVELGHRVCLFGAISKKNAPLYSLLLERHELIFNAFGHQVRSILTGKRKSQKIEEQIKQISKSELELKKLSLIATKNRNGVVISDMYGRMEWVNDAFSTITGYSKEEAIGKRPKDLLQREDADPLVVERLSDALKNKEEVEVVIVNHHKSGAKYYNNLQITPVFDEQGQLINYIALQRDITKEVVYKEELERVTSRLDMINVHSKIGIWEWDARTNVSFWNEALKEQYGVKSLSIQDLDYDLCISQTAEEDRIRLLDANRELMEGDGDAWRMEYRIIRYDTNEERILDSLTIAERDLQGKVIRLVGSSVDITERKHSEEAILAKNEELKKINAELDNFVYRVSHDLRSPLLAIKGLIGLIFGTENLTEEVIEYLKLAESSVGRLDSTIQEILEYSRNSRLEVMYEEVDMKKKVDTIIRDLQFADKNISFEESFPENTVIVTDRSRMRVLLKNLIGNAVKYQRKDEPNHWVKVAMEYVDQDIVITVSDNGEGIHERSLPRIFDMFYRGTTSSIGTGLGLYICKEVLNNLNGSIQVESTVGVGTTMTVRLPKIELPTS